MGYLLYNLFLKTTLWVIVMVYLGIIASFLLIKSIKASKEEKFLKDIFRAIAFYYYFYILFRLFFLFSDYERDANNFSLLHYRYWAMGYVFAILGLLNIIYFLEKYVITRSRHIITYISIIGLSVNIFLIIFYPNLLPIIRYINYGLTYSLGIIGISTYIYLIIKGTGEIRKNSLIIFIGLLVYVLGSVLEIEDLSSTFPVLIYYSPIVVSIGVTIFAYGNWRSTKKITFEKGKFLEEAEEPKVSFIEALSKSKPVEITEKEVSLYREQLICLVCKGKVGGFNKFIFICTNCKALYCETCARTLSTSENICWVCNHPIDESKPVKPFKKEVEEIDLEISEKPQKKPKVDK